MNDISQTNPIGITADMYYVNVVQKMEVTGKWLSAKFDVTLWFSKRSLSPPSGLYWSFAHVLHSTR